MIKNILFSTRLISATALTCLFGGQAFAQTESEVFKCVTEKHTIVISEPAKGTYHYRSWNKPKAVSDKPDMDLKSTSLETSGDCQRYYKFKTGKVEFEVTNQWSCMGKGEYPPASAEGATGDLYVKVGGELKNHYYCYK